MHCWSVLQPGGEEGICILLPALNVWYELLESSQKPFPACTESSLIGGITYDRSVTQLRSSKEGSDPLLQVKKAVR